MSVKDPLVSVIIPTKNSSDTLAKCLNSVIGQTYKNIEIIVVDNYSQDSTLDIAKCYTNKNFTAGPERSAQLNFGAKQACGKYLYRVDSDFVLEPSIVSESVVAAESNNYAAILIHNTSDPSVSYWAKVRKFERDMYQLDDLNVAVRFIRKDVFNSVGGFDVRLDAAEDYDLHNRIIKKYEIGRIRAKETHIGEYRTIKEIALRYYHYGRSIELFLKKNKNRGIRQTIPFRITFAKNYRKFLSHPCLTAGFIIYQIVKYFSCACGILTHALRMFL
jgi:glycosyltransferase involved in cell wall biosynthesis